jgi:hypothetical protein
MGTVMTPFTTALQNSARARQSGRESGRESVTRMCNLPQWPISASEKDRPMTARKKLEQEARQLTEIIKVTCKELDSRTLADADREQLRKQVDLRIAARKHILKQLWVTPKWAAGESRQP